MIDKRIAVRVTNTTEAPYLNKKKTQIAEFSVVTPEQSKCIKPVDMAILKMTPQSDADLTAYLNEILWTKKPEQQNNTFWFPTPENFGKREDHTPIQTYILREIVELKRKEKLNSHVGTESRTEIFEPFDWNNTLWQKERNKQFKLSWSTLMTFLPDTEWMLAQTGKSSWN